MMREHEKIPYNSAAYRDCWGEGMRVPGQHKGLDRWFFRWQWRNPLADEEACGLQAGDDESGYYASYLIGAQWFDRDCTLPLVVTTKQNCDKVDFLHMFSTCFNSGIEADEFSKIYAIDIDRPPIKAPELASVLSPLIVVHFLSVMREVIRHGLKKGYVPRAENLNKVKGRIAIFRNERTNILKKRFDKVYCNYQEYSVNVPENRLLKKALLFSRRILQNQALSGSLQKLQQTTSSHLALFGEVDEEIEAWEVRSIKHNKLFKAYSEAIRLAQMILRHYDYSITNITPAGSEYCPVFWMDMSLLYEHYVLGLLKEAYGDKIKYQSSGYTGFPDFVCHDPRMVMDTKYIPHLQANALDVYIVRQLSGYARDRRLFSTRPGENLPCLVIYPKEGEPANPFLGKPIGQLMEQEDSRVWGFYRIAVPLPTLEVEAQPCGGTP